MPARLEFGCLPTAIGSMPHTDPDEACSVILKYLPDIPVWPQLPGRASEEGMVVQCSEGFPGLVFDGGKVSFRPSAGFENDLEQIHVDSEEGDFHKYGISARYAAGLAAFLSRASGSRTVKGQIVGPVTWGLTVTGEDGLGILYDDTLAETAARFLRLKASWQENELRRLAPNTIVFVDEPHLVSLGSVFTPIPEEKVPLLLNEVFKGIRGVRGLHCCGNSNWSVLMDTGIDVLSFDAYNYASSLSAHSDRVKSFLERGGGIAWGIVPSDEEALAGESLSSLRDRLEDSMAMFTRDGIRFRQIVTQGLITPSCGLASLSPEVATRALELTAEVSRHLRSRYVT
ncbi:MAG: methionine synthase [Dehalococcoidia bacterium]